MFTQEQVKKLVASLNDGVRRASREVGLYSWLDEGAKKYYATLDALFAAASDPATFLATVPDAGRGGARDSTPGPTAIAAAWERAFAKAAAEKPER